ncbi:hypothetical protein ACTFIV_008589 [Dictyostelium citrinum]
MSSQEVFKKYEQKIDEYQNHIEELKSTKNDYKQLIDTLQHLPDTLQPKIMVPMGKLAFFEGNLKNTNEILILLGDNYFAKRSSKQTIDIIQRRDKDIDTSINDLREQIKGIKQRISMTTDLSKALHEKEYDNIVEIKEEYNSDEEREKEKKRKQQPPKSTTTTTTTTTTTSKNKAKTEEEKKKSKEMDEEFDKMLKRLSILEEKESKMGDDYDEEEFNKKFNKKLDITGSDEEYGDDDYNNNDDEDEEDDHEYYQEEGFEDEKPENYNKYNQEEDDDEEGEEIIEYYDENGNIVDINDPNVEYIQGDEDDNNNEEDDDNDEDVELNESELEEIKDFHMDKKGQDLSEKEVKELTDFYHSKQKKRISYIDTPQPPTPEATTTITPKSILKTNSSGNLMSTTSKSYNENDENDIRRYIKNLDKQDKFENQKTISVPNPPKDMAFSGNIVEKQTDLFPFDEIPKPTPPSSNAKQSRFKSSRQNK